MRRQQHSSLLVVFDLDGTLVDSRADLTTAVNRARADFALAPLALATVAGYVGDGVAKLVERSFADATAVALDAAIAAVCTHYSNNLVEATQPYAGVVPALNRLSQAGATMAVLTNKPGDMAVSVLEQLNLQQFFATVVGGGMGLPLKPDPAALLWIRQHVAPDAAHVWMVGDHCTDLTAGRRAGFSCCHCRYGFGTAAGLPAELSIDNLGELAEYLLD